MEFRPDSPAVKLVERLWTNAAPGVLKFGTDGCYFQKFGLETVVFGPGQMSQMHQPEEHILTSEIEECLKFLTRLCDHMINAAERGVSVRFMVDAVGSKKLPTNGRSVGSSKRLVVRGEGSQSALCSVLLNELYVGTVEVGVDVVGGNVPHVAE